MPKKTLDKDFELLLKQSQESLQFALQSGGMGTWDIDLTNKTVSCSQSMLDLWGISLKAYEFDRSELQSKVHPDDFLKMISAIEFAISNNTIYELEYRIHPSPGVERWVKSRGRCTMGQDATTPLRFSGVVYDITDKKLKEEELANAAKIKNQFYMIAGHELKTPLTCLHLEIQAREWELKNNYAEAFSTEKVETSLRKQREHLLRITRLVDNILDESKIADGKLLLEREQFDLCEIVANVIERFKIIAHSSQIEVKFNPTQKISGKWDCFRLEQVIINLLINAIRYGNKLPIEIEVKQDANLALIIVRDRGIGIKESDQKRIFERFERAISENDVSGIGLGLYISNNIVQAHGGEIRLKSEFGVGSEFTVVLPIGAS